MKVLAEAGLVEEAPELAKDRRERWWRLVSTGFRWSRAEFADDPSAVAAALSAESLGLRQQFERAREWLDNHEAAGEWGDAAFATQYWLKLTPEELRELGEEILELLQRWRAPDDPDGAGPFRAAHPASYARGLPERSLRTARSSCSGSARASASSATPRPRCCSRCWPWSASAPARAGWGR